MRGGRGVQPGTFKIHVSPCHANSALTPGKPQVPSHSHYNAIPIGKWSKSSFLNKGGGAEPVLAFLWGLEHVTLP